MTNSSQLALLAQIIIPLISFLPPPGKDDLLLKASPPMARIHLLQPIHLFNTPIPFLPSNITDNQS